MKTYTTFQFFKVIQAKILLKNKAIGKKEKKSILSKKHKKD